MWTLTLLITLVPPTLVVVLFWGFVAEQRRTDYPTMRVALLRGLIWQLLFLGMFFLTFGWFVDVLKDGEVHALPNVSNHPVRGENNE